MKQLYDEKQGDLSHQMPQDMYDNIEILLENVQLENESLQQ